MYAEAREVEVVDELVAIEAQRAYAGRARQSGGRDAQRVGPFGDVPVPVTAIVCGLFAAVSMIVNCAVRVPVASV